MLKELMDIFTRLSYTGLTAVIVSFISQKSLVSNLRAVKGLENTPERAEQLQLSRL